MKHLSLLVIVGVLFLALAFHPAWSEAASNSSVNGHAPAAKQNQKSDAPANKQSKKQTPKKKAAPVNGAAKRAAAEKKIPVFQPTKAEIEAAEQRIALKQTTAELVVAYKYQLRSSVPFLMRKLKKLAPDSAELLYFEALQFYEKGERGRALAKVKETNEIAPHISRAWNLRGIILSEADRVAEARSAFEQAVLHNPYNPNYVYNLASALYRLGEIEAAEKHTRRSLRLKANLSESYYLQARIHRDRREFPAALKAFAQAHDYGQKSQSFLLDYLLAAEAAGDDSAVPELAARLAGVREPRALRELARVHASFGEYKKSVAYYARLLRSPEAKSADRRQYVHALHKSKNKSIKLAIRRIPKIEAKERDALLKYMRELEDADRTRPGTRDPMLGPIK